MFQVAQNIYCSWKLKHYSQSDKMVTGLLFGQCGVGKSRLMNNLCNTAQKVGIARQTLTKQLYQGFVKGLYPENIFSLFDSPGVHPNDNQGSLIIRRSLKFLQWNVILIQAKLQPRFQDNTLTQLVKLTKIFGTQQKLQTVYLVSHADILDQDPKNKSKVLYQFKKSLEIFLPNKKVILFSNENSDFSILNKILYSCAVQFDPCTYDIEDKRFCRNLGYQNIKDRLEDDIRAWYSKIKNQPQVNKKNHMLDHLYHTIPQIYNILKYHVNQMHVGNANKTKQQFTQSKSPTVLAKDSYKQIYKFIPIGQISQQKQQLIPNNNVNFYEKNQMTNITYIPNVSKNQREINEDTQIKYSQNNSKKKQFLQITRKI